MRNLVVWGKEELRSVDAVISYESEEIPRRWSIGGGSRAPRHEEEGHECMSAEK